ncbi:unnamed protein product [Phaedon cochleariae]|uniref:Uncharacterized protein n=1 Tax=Phaedon cochleariae TaxID=80249 RepID=A0A9P0DUG4_PHACE|nr:unnamed protein product [Phaedon cochleariae]
MDVTKHVDNPNPRDKANFLSVLFFSYTIPIFRKGMRKTLEVDDLYNPLRKDRSRLLGDALERNWEKEISKPNYDPKTSRALLLAVIRTFWTEYLFMGVLVGFGDLFVRTTQPLLLGMLLNYYNPESDTTKTDALYYAGGIVLCNITVTVIMSQYFINCMHAGMRVRTAVCALMYRKSVKLSKTALGDSPPGKVVNLLSNDVNRFDMASMMIHQLWIGPISAAIVMYYLYLNAGLPGIAGIAVIIVMSPLQAYGGKLAAKFRKQTALKTDERIRLMDEVICGIQVIKMYAWEIPFNKLVGLARRAETKIIKKGSYARAFFMAMGMFTTRLALFATLITISLSGQEITAAKVFVLMSYFNMLSMTLTALFVRGVTEVAELFISLRRLQMFLANEEYEYDRAGESHAFDSGNDGKEAVKLKNLSAKWNKASSDDVLHNIDLKANRGKLIGVIGPVGSGKSSLLQTLLGELEISDGTMNISGRFSYASQEPWVFSSTIRQNIVFGAEFDKKRYKEVIRVCALERDFAQFPNRDHTIVGDKGASLSGGQKARINLARAVYRDMDIYLLDDPLSAVDIHVSKTLYEECINGFLAGKTRILVTHQVHYLKNADNIIILNNGRIEKEGSFNDLSNSDNLYAKLLTTEPEPVSVKEEITRKESIKYSRQISKRSRKSSTTSIISARTIVDGVIPDEIEEEDDDDDEEENIKMKDVQEESSKGKVVGSLLLKYMRSGASACNVALVLFLFGFAQVAASSVDWFISLWTNIEEYRELKSSNATVADNWYPDFSTEVCLYIYGGLIMTLLTAQLSRSFSFYSLATVCSMKLHEYLFQGIIGATMRFFDTNPSGRILNRFSKDIGFVDEMVPRTLLDAGQMILQMIGSLVLVTSVNPYLLILILILAITFWFIRHIYLKSSKNLKRLEGMMRSPVFTHLGATLQGLSTIRAFRAEDILIAEFDNYQDYSTGAWFMSISAGSAFGFSLDVGCSIFIALVTFSFIVFDKELGITAGSVGLAMSQANQLSGMVQFAMRMTANIANQLMSVERIVEYKELPPEPQPIVPAQPPKGWPHQGQITFGDMSMSYFEGGPRVLKNLSFKIRENEKVGIVGRTGAGKSSLIGAIFRLTNVEGLIEIDGLNTKDLQLRDLRSKITIIPQDPVLFSGTLRYNLDPFEEFTDEQLYRAIDEVELKDPANVINRLENRVMDRGSNYSVGQRQLICLARAIIRNNKILMLDEATANVDPQTDGLIQKTIRTKFADCTVLTVAHRLNTIMDSDRVLVIEQGEVAEFDHPHVLLQNETGIFCKMVDDTGASLSEQLRRIARDNYTQTRMLAE